MEFANKVVAITGAAQGIGAHVAQTFVAQGAKVAVIDRLPTSGYDLCFCGDIAEEETLSAFVSKVHQQFGAVDFLINNACLSKGGLLSHCSYDDFNYVLRVGVTAPYYLVKSLNFNEGGAIVNISSTRAKMSQPDTESYSAAKGGIFALTHALAVSLSSKVRVNSISPGWIDTVHSDLSPADKNQHPCGRVGLPEDITQLCLFLCSQKSSFITGQDFVCDGGMTKQMIYTADWGWSYETK